MVEFQGQGGGREGECVSPDIQQPSCVAGVKLTTNPEEAGNSSRPDSCLPSTDYSLFEDRNCAFYVCFPSAWYRELAQCMGEKAYMTTLICSLSVSGVSVSDTVLIAGDRGQTVPLVAVLVGFVIHDRIR